MSIAWIERDLTTLALCWRIERRDGVALGFTAHDRDLVIGGLPYRATPGMTPSAISISDGLEVDTLDVAGALTSDAISAGDLLAGRWDGAAVRLFAVDWQQPEAEPVHLARGTLGEVSATQGGFSAELRGPTAALAMPVVEQTSPECRASLGDKRCRVDLAGRTRFVRVTAVSDAATITIDAAEPIDNAYGQGRLRWIEGPNSGLVTPIAASAGATLTLADPPAYAVAAGTLVEIVEGCDRRITTCATRFANAVNFRGEPYLPGNDLLTRYPGA